MAQGGKDYFGLDWIVSLILAIIGPTSVVCGIITRFKDGNTLAGIVRIIIAITCVGALVLWIVDLVFMIKDHKIWRFL